MHCARGLASGMRRGSHSGPAAPQDGQARPLLSCLRMVAGIVVLPPSSLSCTLACCSMRARSRGSVGASTTCTTGRAVLNIKMHAAHRHVVGQRGDALDEQLQHQIERQCLKLVDGDCTPRSL